MSNVPLLPKGPDDAGTLCLPFARGTQAMLNSCRAKALHHRRPGNGSGFDDRSGSFVWLLSADEGHA